jgi:hypothetical protein
MKILKFMAVSLIALQAYNVCAQSPSHSGMETYSPYTPGQLREFNSQPLSPVEGPMGPVSPSSQSGNLRKQVPDSSNFFSQPQGEEEAEALETQSADPYQPMKPVMTF